MEGAKAEKMLEQTKMRRQDPELQRVYQQAGIADFLNKMLEEQQRPRPRRKKRRVVKKKP